MTNRIGLCVAVAVLISAAACGGGTGPAGPAGANGDAGPQGPAGQNGTNGTNGSNGSQGAAGEAGAPGATGATGEAGPGGRNDTASLYPTATKIKHLVVIFGENISFDHYFGTYPTAQNNTGEPPFIAATGTPAVNSLVTPLDPTHGFARDDDREPADREPDGDRHGQRRGRVQPVPPRPVAGRDRGQGHNYKPEQQASDNGAMDLFPEYTGTAGPPPRFRRGRGEHDRRA